MFDVCGHGELMFDGIFLLKAMTPRLALKSVMSKQEVVDEARMEPSLLSVGVDTATKVES